MKELSVFKYKSYKLSAQLNEKNDVWFLAKEVCQILQLDDVRRAVERLADDEKLSGVLLHSGQNRRMWLVNEPGIWRLTLTSNKPEAEEFKRYLTHEILPQIRKKQIRRKNKPKKSTHGRELGSWILDQLQLKGVSTVDSADKIGVRSNAIGMVVRGQRASARIRQLIAEAFGVEDRDTLIAIAEKAVKENIV